MKRVTVKSPKGSTTTVMGVDWTNRDAVIALGRVLARDHKGQGLMVVFDKKANTHRIVFKERKDRWDLPHIEVIKKL